MVESAKKIKILCVDDELEILQSLGESLRSLGYDPILARSKEEALKILGQFSSDITLIISDLHMPGGDGLEFRTITLDLYRDIPFVVYSGYVTRELALRGIELKIAAFLDKPIRLDDLKATVEVETSQRITLQREKMELEKTFVAEAQQILEDLEPQLMALEKQPDDSGLINSIFRLIHTLKGSSGVLDTEIIVRFAHRLEDMLSVFKRGDRKVNPEDITVMLQGCDILKNLVGAIPTRQLAQFKLADLLKIFESEGKPSGGHEKASDAHSEKSPKAAGQAGPAATPVASAREGIKISMQTLDEFMELSGEITVIRNMVNKLVKAIEKAQPGNRDVALLIDLLDEMHKINSSMQEKIVDMRKVPLANVLRPLPRTIRDLSRQLQKDIELNTTGDALRIDSTISQVLSDSLIHLVRNSADHGIEDPQQRQKQGKDRKGTIAVRGYEDRDNVVIEIEDNGRGIDPDRVKSKLLENGMATREELAQMPESKLLHKIFEPGFSTAATVSDVSGRGVGMDMVKSAVDRLHGSIEIETNKGKGTKFTLFLPIPKSVMILNSLLTHVDGQMFAIPHDMIRRLFRLDQEQRERMIMSIEGGFVIQVEEHIVPLVHMGECLKLSRFGRDEDPNSELCVVLVEAGETRFGLIVDSIIDSEEIVVKPLGKHLEVLEVYAGATFLGDGTVGLILSVEGIAKRYKQDLNLHHAKLPENKGEVGKEAVVRSEYLLCRLRNPGLFGVPTAQVFRIENIQTTDIQYSGDQPVVIYRDSLMHLYDLCEELKLRADMNGLVQAQIPLVVTHEDGRYFGFIVNEILDIVDSSSDVMESVVHSMGLQGEIFLGDRIVTVVDLRALLESHGLVKRKPIELPKAPAAVAPLTTLPLPSKEVVQIGSAAGWGVFD